MKRAEHMDAIRYCTGGIHFVLNERWEQFFAYIEKLENGEQSITEWIQSGKTSERALIFVGIIGLYVLSGLLSCRIFNSDKEA